MAASLHPVDALRSVYDALLERDDPASAMVATAINGMLDEEVTFEAGMGLASGWRTAMRLRERDAALAEIAGCFPGLCGRKLARAVATACRRYEGTAWQRDRAARRRPDGLPGLLYDLLAAGGILGRSQMCSIFKSLAGQSASLRLANPAPRLPVEGDAVGPVAEKACRRAAAGARSAGRSGVSARY